MKPLIIGEAPSREGDPGKPIEGTIGHRLAAIAGLTFDAYLEVFERVNLLHEWPGHAGKGSDFPFLTARDAALRLIPQFESGRVVLLLGKRLARAFGLKKTYFERQSLGKATAYVVPHPSGVNRFYNDSTNIALASDFLKEVMKLSRFPDSRFDHHYWL